MDARTGLVLRLVGPLIEIVCVLILVNVRDRGRLALGVPVEYFLYAGLALGLTLVVVGLTCVRPRRDPRRPGDRD
jgi:hypothetical protein